MQPQGHVSTDSTISTYARCFVSSKRNPSSSSAVGSCIIAFGLYMCFGFEFYCYVSPSIDTRYASAFSERKFAQVRVGMSMDEVMILLR